MSIVQKIKEYIPYETQLLQRDNYMDIQISYIRKDEKTPQFGILYNSSSKYVGDVASETEPNRETLTSTKETKEFVNREIIMSIDFDDTWEDIKRHIDAQLKREIDRECSICFIISETERIRRVSCPECANNWCPKCYLTMVRDQSKNKEFVKCPFCRKSFGDYILPCYTLDG